MSDYHRVYMKLNDLLERGHCLQLEKHGSKIEAVVFEHVALRDHCHVDGENLPEVVDAVHAIAVARWPKEDD